MEGSPKSGFDPQVVAVWAQYAKERHDAHEKRLSDLRGWARQLAAGMGVMVGVEAALLAQVLKLGESVDSWVLLGPALVFLLGVIAYQLVALSVAVRVGYVGRELLGAESPVTLADHLEGQDEVWARRTIGAYYAKGADNVHGVAEAVARDIAAVVRRFRVSLVLLFVVMVLTSGLVVASSPVRKTMADTPAHSGSSPAPASQAPAAPVPPPSPLLVTPTPGQIETHGAQPPRGTMISTPTPGLRITEGVGGKSK